MTNKNKLKARIVEFGFSQKDIAAALGISKQSFNMRLNGKRGFKVSEVAYLCNVLQIEHPFPDYF